jgi:hypothetical protein
MQLVGLGNTRILTNYAKKSPSSVLSDIYMVMKKPFQSLDSNIRQILHLSSGISTHTRISATMKITSNAIEFEILGFQITSETTESIYEN